MMELLIGDRAWSSWSLRAFLVLRRAGVDFVQTRVPLRRNDTRAQALAAGSPSGQVPALRVEDGDWLWDSLAIAEWAAEQRPERRLWPEDAWARALARCAAAEMHAGFAALRADLPMDLTASTPRTPSEAAGADLRRIVRLWIELRARFAPEGAFLFGPWSIADAFYAPVATRLRTYAVDLSAYGDDGGVAAAYSAALLADPHLREWEAEA